MNNRIIKKSDKANKPVRFFAVILAMLILASIPFAVLSVYAASMKPVYGESYYAALAMKRERLKTAGSPKIVVIGGSSVAFGIDSKIAEKELGMPVVNFGLYAAIGLKPMLELSLGGIGKGDIVVIAPEYDAQMCSDFVGYESLLKAAESDAGIITSLGVGCASGFLSHLTSHIAAKRSLAGSPPEAAGVYSLGAFDNYGDIVYERQSNIMDDGVSANNLPTIDASIVTDSFAEMINRYVKRANRRGATVYFGFAPVNRLAAEKTETDAEGFVAALDSKLACKVIQSLDQHIMDPGYFYDSNYHMNDSGVIYNTVLLVDDLKRESGRITETVTAVPKPPAYSSSGDVLSSGETDGIKYDITPGGAVITGLTDEGLAAESITVPGVIENCDVYKIASRAFAGCHAKTIVLPSSIRVMSAALFDGASSLETVKLNAEKLPEVGDGLLDGAPDSVMITVPESAYGNYVTNYFWTRYSAYLTK